MDMRPPKYRPKSSINNITLNDQPIRRRKIFVYNRPYAHKAQASGKDAQSAHVLSQTTALTVAQLSRKMVSSKAVIKAARTAKQRPDLPRQGRSHVLRRQAVVKSSLKYRASYRRPIKPLLFSAMAVLLLAVGSYAVFSKIRIDEKADAQVAVLAAKANKDTGLTDSLPSEDDPPADITSYTVAPDLPRFMRIEKINANARVRQVSASINSMPKSPSNIFDIGWYDGSAKPGENGTVVIDGHVTGPTKHGVFFGISTLKPGDKVYIERGDGEILSYSVVGTKFYDNDKVNMSEVMAPSASGKPALNIISSAGRFNVRTNQFEQRTVVFTIQDN